MPKYTVTISGTVIHVSGVEADTAEEAITAVASNFDDYKNTLIFYDDEYEAMEEEEQDA